MGQTAVSWRIAPIEDSGQLQACVELQRQVWSFGNPDLVSASMLTAAAEHGGTLLGAVAEAEIVGFVFGFPAWWEGRRIEHSHMLAVQPSWRDSGIGRALKQAQCRRVRQQGIDLVTWTFDPLEAKNAHLNVNRLGVRVRRYYCDLYGASTTSELHSGLGTDRFLAEWDVGREAERDLPARRGTPVLRVVDAGGGRLDFEEISRVDEPWVEIAVPPDIQALKAVDIELARRWRAVTRSLFVDYFARGYGVRALRTRRDGGRVLETAYLLSPDPEP